MNSGIYFLIKKSVVVYIGQSKNLASRISSSHSCNGKYDSVRFIFCDASKMKEYEARWIAKFKPRYNNKLNPDKRIKITFCRFRVSLPKSLYNKLKDRAEAQKRSLNKESELIFEKELV